MGPSCGSRAVPYGAGARHQCGICRVCRGWWLPAEGVVELSRLGLAHEDPGPAPTVLATRWTGLVAAAFRYAGTPGTPCASGARHLVCSGSILSLGWPAAAHRSRV